MPFIVLFSRVFVYYTYMLAYMHAILLIYKITSSFSYCKRLLQK